MDVSKWPKQKQAYLVEMRDQSCSNEASLTPPGWPRSHQNVTENTFFHAAGLCFRGVRLLIQQHFFPTPSKFTSITESAAASAAAAILDNWMNSDTSGGKRADSAPALGDAAYKRSPRAFVCMNIVSRALAQNINNASRRGCRGATREAKQISGAHNGLIPMVVLSIMFVGESALGPGSLLLCDDCQLWKICRNFWKVLLPSNGSAHLLMSRANLKAAAGCLIINRHEDISQISSQAQWTFTFCLNRVMHFQQVFKNLCKKFGQWLHDHTTKDIWRQK